MEIKTNKTQENFDSLKTTLSNTRAWPFLKSKFTKILAATILTLLLLAYVIPLFFNNSSLNFQVTHKVGEILGADLSINKVRIAIFPTPRIILHNVLIKDYKPNSENLDVSKIYNFYAKKILIKLPIFNFRDNFKITELVFEEAVLEKYYDNGSADKRNNKLASTLNSIDANPPKILDVGNDLSGNLFPIEEFSLSSNSYNPPKITLKNSSLIIYDAFGRKKEIAQIDGSLFFSKKKIIANASFLSENILSKLDAAIYFNSAIGDNDSYLELSSPVLNLNIVGDFTLENKILEEGFLSNNFHGKITANIAELKLFYQSYVSSYGVIADGLKFSRKPITIASNVVLKDGEISFENLKTDSTLFEGNGVITIGKNDKKHTVVDIDLNLENLDLDTLWTGKNSNNKTGEKTDNSLSTSPQVIDLKITSGIQDIDLNTEIKAKNVKYLNGQVRNVSLYLTASNDGKILVLPLIFEIPGEGVFRINGVIDNNQINPKFIGKIDGSGSNLGDSLKWLEIKSQNLKFDNLKKYTLYSNILMVPDSVSFNNLYLSLNDNDSEILGELTIRELEKSTDSSGSFRVSNFNVGDYFFTSAQNIYLSPGSLLKKFLWLNDLTASGDFNITFDKLFYKNEVFTNQNTKFRFRNGFLEIHQTSFYSDKIDLKTSLIVDISETIPKFDLDISGDKFHYETPKVSFVNKDGSVVSDSSRNFFDQIYALPSIEEFIGKIKINIADVKIDGVDIENFTLGGDIKNGNIANARSNFGIYGGTLNYNGFLGIKLRKTINGNLTLKNAEINPLLTDIFNIENIHGIVSLSSSITSVADNKKDFLKDLSSEIKFNSNSPYIEGYGLGDLIKKMLYRAKYQEELKNPESVLLNKDSRTIFKQARGSFYISGGTDPKLKIDINAPAMNAILSGAFNPSNNSLDLLFNAIFITGDSKKQIPINIATSLRGKIDNPSQSTNLDQAKQYLGLIKIDKAKDTNILPTQQGGVLEKTSLIENQTPNSQILEAPTKINEN